MSWSLILGIALIIAFAIWILLIGYSKWFERWLPVVVIITAAWMIAFVIEMHYDLQRMEQIYAR